MPGVQCFLAPDTNAFSYFTQGECLKVSDTKRNVLIIGDSHAQHLVAGYRQAFPDVNFMQATAFGCYPVLGAKGERGCADLIEFMFKVYLPSHRVDIIVLSARWNAELVPKAIETAGYLASFAGRVVISGPIPEYDVAVPRLLARVATGEEDIAHVASRHLLPKPKSVDAQFSAAELPIGVTYISVYKALCNSDCTMIVPDDVPSQIDYGHLTKEGARYLGGKVGAQLFGGQ